MEKQLESQTQREVINGSVSTWGQTTNGATVPPGSAQNLWSFNISISDLKDLTEKRFLLNSEGERGKARFLQKGNEIQNNGVNCQNNQLQLKKKFGGVTTG